MTTKPDIALLIIDPQNDFMGLEAGAPLRSGSGPLGHQAALPVKGAVSDMWLLATLIERLGERIDRIVVTLDQHRPIDVGHPFMWSDADGNHPAPLGAITSDDIRSGRWRPRSSQWIHRFVDYAEALEAKGMRGIDIWPEHCLIGSWGACIERKLSETLNTWERYCSIDSPVRFALKGANPFTEHYGAFEAEVPDLEDPLTQFNEALVDYLRPASRKLIGGEASSHCVLATVKQLASRLTDEEIRTCELITDCMSPVAGFEAQAEAFLNEMEGRGMRLVKSTDLA